MATESNLIAQHKCLISLMLLWLNGMKCLQLCSNILINLFLIQPQMMGQLFKCTLYGCVVWVPTYLQMTCCMWTGFSRIFCCIHLTISLFCLFFIHFSHSCPLDSCCSLALAIFLSDASRSNSSHWGQIGHVTCMLELVHFRCSEQ